MKTPLIPSHCIEITKEAAWLLIGNDERSWVDYRSTELAEASYYRANGVNIIAVCNFIGGIVQYYVQDINA
jgi:hypothetical protein